jgi:hypothetical protein
MSKRAISAAATFVVAVMFAQILAGEQIKYAGTIVAGSDGFSGTGRFKFAVIDPAGKTYWSNDGTSLDAHEPERWIEIPVTKGIYNIVLGDEAVMLALPQEVTTVSGLSLRVWFSDGAGPFQKLEPDQLLKSREKQVISTPQQAVLGAAYKTQLHTQSYTAQDILTTATSTQAANHLELQGRAPPIVRSISEPPVSSSAGASTSIIAVKSLAGPTPFAQTASLPLLAASPEPSQQPITASLRLSVRGPRWAIWIKLCRVCHI